MPLSVQRLSAGINDILNDYDQLSYTDLANARNDFSTKLATAIINEIKNATVSVPAGGLTAGSNAVTGQATGTIS